MAPMIASPSSLMHFKTEGSSMGTFIEAGDELIVKRLFRHQYRLGDVVVYMHPELETPIAHRLRWIQKPKNAAWIFCFSGDSHPLMFEWIHEDFIRGKVEIIIHRQGQKITEQALEKNYRQSLWKSFLKLWIRHLIKNFGISLLSCLQSLQLYRRIMRGSNKSRIHFTRFDHPDYLGLEVKIGDTFAGRGHLLLSSPSSGEIVNLEVRSRYQGMGVGEKIMHSLIDEARKRGKSHLNLLVWNQCHAALRLYQKLGFQKAGEEIVTSVRWPLPRIMNKMELWLVP